MKLQSIFIVLISVIIVVTGITIAYIFIVPRPEHVLEEYLTAWQKGNCSMMYSLFSEESKAMISAEEFEVAYSNFFQESGMIIQEINEIKRGNVDFREAELTFQVKADFPYFGKNELLYRAFFIREGLTNWKIDWQYNMIYPELNNGERVVRRRHLPKRGAIFDRHGEPLAIKGEIVTVGIQPIKVEDMDELAKRLEELLEVNPDWVKNKFERFSNHPEWFFPVKSLSIYEYERLNQELRPIPGIFFQRNEGRVYPQADKTAHVVGYVGEVTGEWLNSHLELDYLAGDTIGRAGIEMVFEEELRGEPGYTLMVKDVTGGERILMERLPVRGDDIYLSLDMTFQRAAWNALDDKEGSLVVIDPVTGDLLALVNRPAFDSNRFSLGITTGEWQALCNDPRQPMFNKALQGLYPPGSIFKVVTASAALNAGIVNSTTEFNDEGSYRVDGNLIRNYQGEVFGEHQFVDAVAHSINTTFVKIGINLGSDRFKEYATRFGLEEEVKFPLDVRTSKVGNLEAPVNLAWTAVGQAQVAVTPLQMAEIMATIAGDGEFHRPLLIYKKLDYSADGKVIAEEYSEIEVIRKVIRAEKARELINLLVEVVERGTATKARIPGFKLAGKTGTAEISSSSDLNHAWFIGLAPADEPVIAFSVFIKEGGVGGEVAAPTAREFLEEIFKLQGE